MDVARAGVPALSGDPGTAAGGASGATVDLHVHSTASDGTLPPERVIEAAAAAGLAAVALTDHDTVAGLPAALAAGARLGVRVVAGCEFSVAVSWGEMHLLGYFLPAASDELESFLVRCRIDRERRGRAMVDKVRAAGVVLDFDQVLAAAGGGAIGRPHVARALVRQGAARDVQDAFDRYLGRGRPAFVEKALPPFAEVAALVHRLGGVVSAAHLKDRGTRGALERLKAEGLDAVETRHPSHDPDTRARLTDLALALNLRRTGGSDWHGERAPEDAGDREHATIGAQQVPLEWLAQLEAARPA
ncbi:MAG TPA: PHP domain-containing protein [Gemmatimonadales bacterium]|nr:PHP domain-containing protein [Gemmatimonadales bacterium]